MPNKEYRDVFSPRRQLGRTGFVATVLGIGDLADRAIALDSCVATIRRAIEAGLNVIDTAPAYEDGYSEQIVGAAIKGYRERLFVIDKIDHLDQPVEPQVVASLQRLDLDQTDLFVFHAVSKMADWQMLAAPGGGMEQLAACIRSGRTRFRGISSHHPDVLRAAIDSGLCNVVLFPVGPFVDERYINEIIPLARRRGVGTVCFKTFGAGKLLCDTPGYNQPLTNRPRGKFSSGGDAAAPLLPHLTVEQCVSYTLTVDPDVALLGLCFPNEQAAAFEAARRFRPLSAQLLAEIRVLAAAAVQEKGDCWWNP